MFLGYNTNGFAHHRLEDACEIVAGQGYRGLALTPDVHHLDPYRTTRDDVLAFRTVLEWHKLACVIETGARFILSPYRKHSPTLLSADRDHRETRFGFLRRCVDTAHLLVAPVVSFWSGSADDGATHAEQMKRLAPPCRQLADYAADHDLRLAFEPEPGMFIDTMEKFAELFDKVNHPAFGLTIDIGHLVCNGELPISKFLAEWKHVLWNVHIEDMRRGVHDHLMFGEGEVDFADVFAGLKAANYTNGVFVELSRHSHDAVNTARKSKEFLDRYLAAT